MIHNKNFAMTFHTSILCPNLHYCPLLRQSLTVANPFSSQLALVLHS